MVVLGVAAEMQGVNGTTSGGLESWAFGARVLACGPAGNVGVDPWPLTPKSSSP